MNVPELDAEARELIEAGREGASPSPLARARVQRSVQAKLAAGLGVAAMSYTPSVLGAAGVKAGALLAVVAAVATGGWYFASTGTTQQVGPPPEPPRTVAPTLVLPQRAAQPERSERSEEPAETADAPEQEALIKPEKLAPKPSSKAGLADEVALLSKASAALNRGQTGRAAQLLGEYDRLGSKHLIEERSATGVLLLCRSGQVPQARTAAKRFFKRFPRSPLATRIQASCAADPSRK